MKNGTEREATPSSPTSPESKLTLVHIRSMNTQFHSSQCFTKLVKVKYLIVEDEKQYRFDGFICSDPALDTLQFPFQVTMQQRDGFMFHVSTVCATVIYITDGDSYS